MLTIDGHCEPRFTAVREEFFRNFTERGDVGAAVCVYVDGVRVVDCWGGHADAARSQPFGADTLVSVASTTKGMVALCAHMLAERGKLDAAKPITNDQKRGIRQHYWAYDNRHVIYPQDADGDENWHLYAVDIVSGTEKDITPYKGARADLVDLSWKKPGVAAVALNDSISQSLDEPTECVSASVSPPPSC